MKTTLSLIFLIAVAALLGGAVWRDWTLIAVSVLTSLTIIAVGIGAGGTRALNPFDRRRT